MFFVGDSEPRSEPMALKAQSLETIDAAMAGGALDFC